jgi:hypothetical protein
MRARKGFERALTLREQADRIRMGWPSFTVRCTRDQLVATGLMQPTPLNDTYRVRIVYESGEPPKAYVDSPPLRVRGDGQPIPHVYPGPRPCLYLPGEGEWTNRRSLARTIIPWLALWLYYYELSHATGEWRGGGADHGTVPAPLDAVKPEPIEPPSATPEHPNLDSP